MYLEPWIVSCFKPCRFQKFDEKSSVSFRIILPTDRQTNKRNVTSLAKVNRPPILNETRETRILVKHVPLPTCRLIVTVTIKVTLTLTQILTLQSQR